MFKLLNKLSFVIVKTTDSMSEIAKKLLELAK